MTVQELAKILAVEGGSTRVDYNLIRAHERRINDILSIIYNFETWTFLKSTQTINTSVGVKEYFLNASGMDVSALRMTSPNRGRLTYKPMDTIVANRFDLTQTSRPYLFSLTGFDSFTSKRAIILTPTPDAVYVLEAHLKIADVALGSDADLPIPPEMIAILKAGVKWLTLSDDTDSDMNKTIEKKTDFYGQLESARENSALTSAYVVEQQLSDILDGEGDWPPPDPRFG